MNANPGTCDAAIAVDIRDLHARALAARDSATCPSETGIYASLVVMLTPALHVATILDERAATEPRSVVIHDAYCAAADGNLCTCTPQRAVATGKA